MKSVTALYDDYATAERAVADLVNAGFSRNDISIVANDATGEYNTRYVVNQSDDMTGGEGATLGAVAGAVIGLGAMLIPGIGPVIAAGPVIAGLVGAGVGAAAGAVTGGITASLVGYGIPEEDANYYAEGVRRGGTLVVVHTNDGRADEAEAVLNRHHSVDVYTRADDWRSGGWTGFDPNRQAYSPEELEAERMRYRESNSRNLNN